LKILLMKPINEVYYVIQPNLGLGYLAQIALELGHEVEILDSGKERLTWERFKEIAARQYDIIGIQAFTHEILSAKRHLEIIADVSPDTVTVMGGAHISALPRETMELLPLLDLGFVGEAEVGFEMFLKGKTVPGLVYRERGIKINPKVTPTVDRLPAWELMKPKDYPVNPHGGFCKKTPVAPMIISRGCPFPCSFCAAKTVTGKKIRYRSIDNVIEELMLLGSYYGVREIHIEDDNFTLRKDYVLEFCRAVTGAGISFALPNGVRLDTLDEEMLDAMVKAGFYSFAVGIESGSDRVLGLMKKTLTTKVVREKIKLIKSFGIQITGFFLLGYPTETVKEIRETIRFSKELPIDKASFMFVMPLPGTDLWRGNSDLENFFYYRIANLSDIPKKTLKRLQRFAVFSFYVRPRILFNAIFQIRSLSQIRIIVKRLWSIFG